MRILTIQTQHTHTHLFIHIIIYSYYPYLTMSRNVGAQARRELIERTFQVIQQHEGVPLEKLESLISYNVGINAKRIKEYLKILVNVDKIEPWDRGFKVKEP